MKISIERHRARLQQQTIYLEWEKACIANKQKLITNSEIELAFLAKQISEAERQGLDEFDGDKFLKSKRTKQKP